MNHPYTAYTSPIFSVCLCVHGVHFENSYINSIYFMEGAIHILHHIIEYTCAYGISMSPRISKPRRRQSTRTRTQQRQRHQEQTKKKLTQINEITTSIEKYRQNMKNIILLQFVFLHCWQFFFSKPKEEGCVCMPPLLQSSK